MPLLSIIICSYKKEELLSQALESLAECRLPAESEIIVSDNSPQPFPAEFQNRFPHVRFIFNLKNIGFGAANNIAFRQCSGKYVAFVNNDTIPEPDAFSKLLEKIEDDYSIGAIAPLVINPPDQLELSFGKKSTIFGEFLQKYFRQSRYQQKYSANRLKPMFTEWLSGCFLLVRRDLFENELPFDENFFLYFEDQDLCLRIKAHQKKILYYPQAKILHLRNQTVKDMKTKSELEYRRSQLYFYRKWNSRSQNFLLKIYLFLKFALRALIKRDSQSRELFQKLKKLITEK